MPQYKAEYLTALTGDNVKKAIAEITAAITSETARIQDLQDEIVQLTEMVSELENEKNKRGIL